MKFAEIIKASGLPPRFYPHASEIDVTVYDDKGRILNEKFIHFPETIFKNNPDSFTRFCYIVEDLEEKLKSGAVVPEGLKNVTIGIHSLIINIHKRYYTLPR